MDSALAMGSPALGEDVALGMDSTLGMGAAFGVGVALEDAAALVDLAALDTAASWEALLAAVAAPLLPVLTFLLSCGKLLQFMF